MTTRPIPTETSAVLSPREKELARHALGLDGRRKKSFRNHYVIDLCDDHDVWMGLVGRKLAKVRPGVASYGGMDCFYLTRAGALAALEPGESLDDEDFPG